MNYPERDSPFASYDQVQVLYKLTSSWLEENGTLTFDAGRSVDGLHNGLPLVSGFAPDYGFNIASKVLSRQVPGAMDVLKLRREPLELNYFIGCYQYDEIDPQSGIDPDYNEPMVRFNLEKEESSGLYDERIELFKSITFNGLVRTNRIQQRLRPGLGNELIEARGLDPGDPSCVTMQEHDALLSIVTVLYRNEPDAIRVGTHWMDKIRRKD